MKRLFFMALFLAIFVGCSKEETPSEMWEKDINSMAKTELTALEALMSADAWRPLKIYKYTQPNAQGVEELYWDINSEAKEDEYKTFMYATYEDKKYKRLLLNEYRTNPADGQAFYYAYEVVEQVFNKDYTLSGPYGKNLKLTFLAYDENNMVLQLYDPNATSYPYTRLLITRVNGAKGLENHENYLDLYDENGQPYKYYKWEINPLGVDTKLLSTLKETPYWEGCGHRNAEIRYDGTLFTSLSLNRMGGLGDYIYIAHKFDEDKIQIYSTAPIPYSKPYVREFNKSYWNQIYPLGVDKDGIMAVCYDYEALRHWQGSETVVYFMKPCTQERFDEIMEYWSNASSEQK